MRVAHNHRPNGMGARNENGLLTCAQCGQPCDDPVPTTPEKSPLPLVPPLIPSISGALNEDGSLPIGPDMDAA